MSGRQTFTARRYARGQALPLGLAFIMFGCLATLILYNSSQLVSKKSHIANAADAAAYSGLVWQARALNFQAYTNRAMVANQVSIAQFVSIASWTQYSKVAAENVDRAIGWLPVTAPFTKGVYTAAVQIEEIIQQITDAVVPVISGVNSVLSAVQQAVYISAFALTPSIVKEVARANDPSYDVDSAYSIAAAGLNIIDWQNFAQQYQGEDLTRKADIINRSRDRFSQNRSWDLPTFLIWPSKYSLRKEGMTHLIQEDGKWAWKARDTLSLHVSRFKCSWKGCGWRDSEVPIGWGGAYASDNLQCRGSGCPTWERHNHRAGRQADRQSEKVENYGGLQAFYDLRDLSAENKDPRLVLRVEVQAPAGAMQTSTQKGFGSSSAVTEDTEKNGFGLGMFRAEDKFAAGTMASLSSAEIYFERPVYNGDHLTVNGQKKHEYGSLWNPYWQVRLSATPQVHRLAAWAMRDDSLVAGVGGVVGGGEAYVRTQQQELEELVDLVQYAGEKAEELPAKLIEKAKAADDLEDLLEVAQSLESEMAVISDQLQATEGAVASSVGRLDAVENEVETISERLQETTDANETQQIKDQLAALSQQRNDLIERVKQEKASAENLLQSHQEKLSELSDIGGQGSALASDLGLLNQEISSAQDLEDVLGKAKDLIGETDLSIDNFDIEPAKKFFNGLEDAEQLVDSLSGDILSNAKDALMQKGKQQIKEFVEESLGDQIKNVLTNAIESAIKGFFGGKAESVEAVAKKIEDASDTAETFVEGLNVDYLKPLEDQLASLKADQFKVRDTLQAELDAGVAAMNTDIDYYRQLLAEEIALVTDDIDPKLNELIQKKTNAKTDEARQALDEKIAKLTARKAQELEKVDVSYRQRIGELESRKQEVIAEFEGKVDEVRAEIEGEIAELEGKIAKLKSDLNLS